MSAIPSPMPRVGLSASTVDEGAGVDYVFTATLSSASHGVTTIHTDQGDITIADGATTGTLTIAANNGEDVYSDASSLTASITGVSGGGFEASSSAPPPPRPTSAIPSPTASGRASAPRRSTRAPASTTCSRRRSPVPRTASPPSIPIRVTSPSPTGPPPAPSPSPPDNGEDVYSDASSLTAHITGVTGGGFESLIVGTATATANVSDT